jgi:hypothetical protein
LERKSWISARSEERAASLPGTVPCWRTAFARVKIVFVGVEGVEDGVRVGVETFRLVGVKREMVRLADTGVAGRPFPLVKRLLRDGTFCFGYLSGCCRRDVLSVLHVFTSRSP